MHLTFSHKSQIHLHLNVPAYQDFQVHCLHSMYTCLNFENLGEQTLGKIKFSSQLCVEQLTDNGLENPGTAPLCTRITHPWNSDEYLQNLEEKHLHLCPRMSWKKVGMVLTFRGVYSNLTFSRCFVDLKLSSESLVNSYSGGHQPCFAQTPTKHNIYNLFHTNQNVWLGVIGDCKS